MRSSPALSYGGTVTCAGVTVRSVRLADVGPGGAAFLDSEERGRAERIEDRKTRAQFLAGRIALRTLAAGILGVGPADLTSCYACPDCGTGPGLDHGRPGYRFRDGAPAGLSLSLSRSGGWALLAAGNATGPGVGLGVDIEHVSGVQFPGFDAVALSPDERRFLAASPPEDAIRWRAAAWARKEALLKARGTGLRTDPTSVEAFTGPPAGTVLVDLETTELGLPPEVAAALAIVDQLSSPVHADARWLIS